MAKIGEEKREIEVVPEREPVPEAVPDSPADVPAPREPDRVPA